MSAVFQVFADILIVVGGLTIIYVARFIYKNSRGDYRANRRDAS